MSVRVANISALQAIPTSGYDRDVAQSAFVTSVGDYFHFTFGVTLSTIPYVVVNSADGLGQWSRMGIPNRTFCAAKYWSVGSGGDDEAQGWGATQAAADVVRLATMKELNRRLVGFDGSTDGWYPGFWGPSIHLTSSITVPMFCVLSNLVGPSGNSFPRIYADLVPVDSNSSNRTLTAYQAAVPASNTERTLTIAGLGSVPTYVAKAVMKTDGTKFAYVTRQPSSNVLAISQVRTFGTTFGTAAIDGSVGSVSDFANGETVSFYDMVSIPDWPFDPGCAYPVLSRVRIANSDSAYFAHGDIGSSSPYMAQVILGHPTYQTSYSLYGGDMDSGGNGHCVQPLFVGSHNTLHNSVWCITSGAAVACNASPFISNCSLAFYGELIMVSNSAGWPSPSGPGVSQLNFPTQNSTQIASFDSTYLYGTFSLGGSDHHGGRSDIYIADGVAWYGAVSGAALRLAGNGNARIPAAGFTLTCPGADLSGIGGTGTKQIILYSNIATPTGKNFADVPFADATTGIRVGN